MGNKTARRKLEHVREVIGLAEIPNYAKNVVNFSICSYIQLIKS